MIKLTWATTGAWTTIEFEFSWILVPETRTTMWSNTVSLLKEVETAICWKVQRCQRSVTLSAKGERAGFPFHERQFSLRVLWKSDVLSSCRDSYSPQNPNMVNTVCLSVFPDRQLVGGYVDMSPERPLAVS